MRRKVTGRGRQAPRTVLLFPVLDFGGIESRAVIQATEMAASGDRIHFVCFAADGRAAAAIRAVGIDVDVLGATPSVRNPVALWRLWRYLRARDVDVLHAVSGAMTVHGMVAGRLAGVPVRIAEEIGIPERSRIGRVLFPLVYRLATCVIGVSDAVVRHLVDDDGVPVAKARRIYNAIERRYFAVSPPRAPAETFTIVTAGRLAPVKGHVDLLRAMGPLLVADPSLQLQVVGDGPERAALEELATQAGIKQQVTFLGYRDDLPDLLAAAQLFVLPSRMEGFGLAVVEAMAARCPVIATRVGGVPEVVPDWAHQWLVEPGDDEGLRDAVGRMRTIEPHERRRLGERLHEHALHRFGPERYVGQLRALYAEFHAQAGRR